MVNNDKKRLFEMMNKAGGMPLINEWDNYNYPEGADNPDAPWNEPDNVEIEVIDWEVDEQHNVVFNGSNGETAKVPIDILVDENHPDYEWFGVNPVSDEYIQKLTIHVDKWLETEELEWEGLDEGINEARFEPETYFETLSGALDEVRKVADSRGFELDEDEIFRQFGTGGIGYGETKRGSLTITKNGKEQRKMLQVVIYRMDSGKYELVTYIN